MTAIIKNELVRRIARLAKQNQELEEHLRKLDRMNRELSVENDRLVGLLEGSGQLVSSDRASKEKMVVSLKFNMATLLYAEIHGFSKDTDGMDSSVVMDELDEIICKFDAIASKQRIEKIKTIGDTYMCAGGIPERNITNPVEVVMAAIEMRNFLESFEEEKRKERASFWTLKTAIHTGPVSATVSGKRKTNYDLKGDTVNTASRIRAVSESGMILISVKTYELVKVFFDCEYYGKLPVKYKGDLELFMVKGLKAEFRIAGDFILPNDAFRIKFGLMQFTDIQEKILDKLENELPENLHYHNVKHTVDVVTEVELIGWAEGCSDAEILILKTAALFHDAGHTISYEDHEFHATVIAREMLPQYGYSPDQVERICSVIMATKLPPKPSNLLESIICDSDLDYLGRSDFIPVSNTLFEELKAQNKMGSLNDWNKLQIKFISGHQYFTKTARNLREVNKQLQIERLQGLITD